MTKKSVFITAFFFAFQVRAILPTQNFKLSDLSGVQIQFNQSLSFGLGKYAEDSSAQVSKGEVQYKVNYDVVMKAKEEADSPFCTFSIAKNMRHRTQDYAQASNEIIEILQQKKNIVFEPKENLNIKDATISHAVIELKIESKKESRILAECITPGAKEDEDPQVLLKNMLETLLNSQAKLTKKGKEFPPQEMQPEKTLNNKRKKS